MPPSTKGRDRRPTCLLPSRYSARGRLPPTERSLAKRLNCPPLLRPELQKGRGGGAGVRERQSARQRRQPLAPAGVENHDRFLLGVGPGAAEGNGPSQAFAVRGARVRHGDAIIDLAGAGGLAIARIPRIDAHEEQTTIRAVFRHGRELEAVTDRSII